MEFNSPSPSSPPTKGRGDFPWGKQFSLCVTSKDLGRRLDQFLSESDLNISRSQVKHLIEQKHILLNQKTAKPGARLKSGDMISGIVPAPQPLSLIPEPLSLSVLYEDGSIVVIDKPSGLVVHPAPGNPSGTLVNALLYHCKDLSGINGALRPGIVHRLDKETSGVMVVAKEDESYHQLIKQFKNRSVEKVYLAIAYGNMKQNEGSIDAPIGRHPNQRKKMSIRTTRGRAALTRWRVLERFGSFTFLEIYPKTGRTHQIRVHLSTMGHPLLGDPLYGRKGTVQDPTLRECIKRMNRQALHAYRLELNHPRTGERVQFIAPIPQDMRETLGCLRSQTSKFPLSLDARLHEAFRRRQGRGRG